MNAFVTAIDVSVKVFSFRFFWNKKTQQKFKFFYNSN